jgi:hypothetical protein
MKDGDEWLIVQKVLVVNLSVVLMLTLSLIRKNMKSNLPMGLLNNMLQMLWVDDEDNMFQLLDEIMDHKKDDTAIDIANGTVTTSSGNVKPKITTQGWQLLMLWKDKSTSWVKLKDLKAFNPVELAEYAVANWIAEEPAFKWWVSNTLRKRNHIISKVKKR